MIVFIITSVLDPIKKPLSYAPIRSRFSPSQRFEQLCRTVQSVEHFFPDARVIIMEGSSSLPPFDTRIFKQNVSFYHRPSPYVDSKWKGLGEMHLLTEALLLIPPGTTHLFKLSGRYVLNQNFDTSRFLVAQSVFRQIEQGSCFQEKEDAVYTMLFKIVKEDLQTLATFLSEQLKHQPRESVEILFYRRFGKTAFLVEELGVEGNISHNGKFIKK